MAEATFSLAVENLGILLIQRADIPPRVQRKARRLRDELERMQVFLSDAADRRDNGRTMRSWISQLREVAQDAEDFIETFGSYGGATTNRRSLQLPAWLACSSGTNVHDPAGEIKSLRERLRGITRMGERYNRIVGASSSRRFEDSERQVMPTTPWHIVEHVVGLEQDVDLLLQRAIFQGRIGLSVAAIVGIGGIGKTTLARLVYNDTYVTRQYFRVWIYVSSPSSLEEIIKKMLMQLLRQNEDEIQMLQYIERLQLTELQVMLQRRLTGKRYLIVLDDVQDIAPRVIVNVLPDEGRYISIGVILIYHNFIKSTSS